MAFGGAPPEPTPCEVWPENWPTVELFLSAATQWRQGFGGPTGLDYAAVEALMRVHGIPKRDRLEVFTGVQLMEVTALRVWADRRENTPKTKHR